MRRPWLAIFVLFFGLSVVEALTDGRWLRVLFWVAMAAIFGALEWLGHRRHVARS